MLDLQALKETLERVTGLAERFGGKRITEQDTKLALIAPVLSALGWSMTDLDVVRAEYRHVSKDNPVDYALFSKGHPVLFVEAKSLDTSVDDHKVVAQVLSYANVSGVGWALVTNGRIWALYKVFAKVQADQKRLFVVDVADPMAAEWLQWIVPSRLAGNDLDDMWRHCFAERRLRGLLIKMIGERDSDLVSFLAQRSGLDQMDVTAGLHHLRVSFDEPEARPPVIDVSASIGAEALTPAAMPSPAPAYPSHVPVAHVPVAPEPVVTPLGDEGGPARAVRRPGTKPTTFSIGDRAWPVRAWKEIPIITCTYLAEVRPQEYRQAFDVDEFQGRKCRSLGREPEMRTPAQVPGGFVEVNLSAENCVGLAKRLVAYCGLDPSTVRYEVR